MYVSLALASPESPLTLNTVTKRYVSFPSFDLYEAREQGEEKEADTKSH